MLEQIKQAFQRKKFLVLNKKFFIAENGKLTRHLDGESLAKILRPAFVHPHKNYFSDFFTKWRK